MDKKEFTLDPQQNPAWVFWTVIILLIQASLAFNQLVLDFYPELNSFRQGALKLTFIFIGSFIFGWIYWKIYRKDKQKDRDPIKMSNEEIWKKSIKTAQWLILRQNIFKHYPLNIITLRVIPLFICWIIKRFINKQYKSYLFDPFYFPEYWEDYNYEEIISKFFKSMFRIYVEKLNQSYEIKFARDFQHIEIRWIDKNTDKTG